MKLFFFSFDELILPSPVLFVNTFSCNKKGSFLQKAKWVFKKGFLQDIRHDLWEILSG